MRRTRPPGYDSKRAGLSKYERFLVQRALQQPAFSYNSKLNKADADLERRISISSGRYERRMVEAAEMHAMRQQYKSTARAIARRTGAAV